jgi:hypothetical protein
LVVVTALYSSDEPSQWAIRVEEGRPGVVVLEHGVRGLKPRPPVETLSVHCGS